MEMARLRAQWIAHQGCRLTVEGPRTRRIITGVDGAVISIMTLGVCVAALTVGHRRNDASNERIAGVCRAWVVVVTGQ